jgi:hypothetical protein
MPFHCKQTELTVTDSIYVTVDWSDREKQAECPTDWLPLPASTTSKDTAVFQYTATSVTDTYVLSTSSTVALSNSSTTVYSTENIQQPKSTSIIPAAAPSTQAAAPTTMTTEPTTDTFKKRGLAYNNAAFIQFFIGSNSKVL